MTGINVIRGDITTLGVDAIVNAANSRLIPGGGVDGAIHAAGGPAIAAETGEIAAQRGELKTGSAVITTAGLLPALRVIHTVGPIWGRNPDDESARLLATCYRSCLDLAVENGCRSIAFPNISTGIYGFPKPLAAKTAVGAVQAWTAEHPGAVDQITFVCFDTENQRLYDGLLGL